MSGILLTGAAGFIGSHVAEGLISRGEEVVGLDNFDPFYARETKCRNLAAFREHTGFRFIDTDIRDAGSIKAIFREHRPSAVIHLAARAGVRPSIGDPAGYIAVNVLGLQCLLSAVTEYPVEHFVFASSSSVYGNRSDPPFRESDRTDEPASPYAATKKAGEALCYTFHALSGVPVSCLRFFTVYGPRQRPDLAIHKFVRMIQARQPIPFYGDGTSRRDYTYVDDTVEGILGALNTPTGYEIYNLGRSDPVTLAEMVKTIELALGEPAVLDRKPDQPGDVAITCADVSKAAAAFGYDPKVEFADGIGRFVAWWREEGDREAGAAR